LNATMRAVIDDTQPTLEGVKVLVVDDEADARELIRLEECHAVITAASAQEALEVLEHDKLDVLVSDIGIPQEDGYQFIYKVRMLGPEQKRKKYQQWLLPHTPEQKIVNALLSG